MCVWNPRTPSRHGITLMEVLIAIGILSIGLTSVAALLPAGGSQARKAIISDRAANLAENALADAITIGLARPLSLTGTASRVVFDPAGSLSLAGTLDASLQASGVLAVTTSGTTGVSKAVGFLFAQGRDDIVFNAPATGDSLPTNAFTDGARAFDGRTTCLWAIESLSNSPIAASSLARLSVVIFQDRDPSSPTLAATVSSTGEIAVTPPAGRTIRDILKTGTVIVASAGLPTESLFFSLRSASPNAAGTAAYGVFDRTPPAGNCTILLDSVGLAQTIVTLEGPGPFSATTPREVVP